MGRTPKKHSSPSLYYPSFYDFIKNIWDKYRWEFFVILSLVTIFFCWLLKSEDEQYRGMYVDTTVLQNKKKTQPVKSGEYVAEEKCREIIQRIFNKPFTKVRPNFLKNPKTGRNLELDMYNPELKIAVEYNGIQHRTYAPYFHKTENHYFDQVERDKFKMKRCKEEGIFLIVVPDTVRYHEMEGFILSELKKGGKI